MVLILKQRPGAASIARAGVLVSGSDGVFSLGHPWGTLATVRDLRDSPQSQKSRYFADSETQKTPWIAGDSQKTHS